MEISNFGRKMRAIWGGKFSLDHPFGEEYFVIVVVVISSP